METLLTLLDFLFGCHHNNLSRIYTLDRQTYRVCCDCGAKFKYSLANMSIRGRIDQAGSAISPSYPRGTSFRAQSCGVSPEV